MRGKQDTNVRTKSSFVESVSDVIQSLESKERVSEFLADLLTSKECQVLEKRWRVAVGLAGLMSCDSAGGGKDDVAGSQKMIANTEGCSETFVGQVRRRTFGVHSSGVASSVALEVFGTSRPKSRTSVRTQKPR